MEMPNVTTVQPGQPGPIHSVGLQDLHGVDKLIVKQKKEMLEIFTGWETHNKFSIRNEEGHEIYYAFESTDMFAMCCLGEARPFTINILDRAGHPCALLDADVNCCGQNVSIQIPPGNHFATIRKEFAFVTPSFYVDDAQGSPMFKVSSSVAAAFGSFGTVDFDIKSLTVQGEVVGRISKNWKGFFKEMFTDADSFGISFPADMDVSWKAVLLALLFHIDFTFYERANRN